MSNGSAAAPGRTPPSHWAHACVSSTSNEETDHERFGKDCPPWNKGKLIGQLESTVRYLGIEVDDALEMAERTEC
ncbi:hypothetical protein [Ectothiorhodospira sp. BSL-9]|uniref:hypothetical protein n=1 Tax=Ectothiorhodospira sp. BSL-9 TaxID=1442136 RepID=UPI0012E8788E|nr:hypothetical protein [Ectothiorhodospira sp. BSL-9]